MKRLRVVQGGKKKAGLKELELLLRGAFSSSFFFFVVAVTKEGTEEQQKPKKRKKDRQEKVNSNNVEKKKKRNDVRTNKLSQTEKERKKVPLACSLTTARILWKRKKKNGCNDFMNLRKTDSRVVAKREKRSRITNSACTCKESSKLVNRTSASEKKKKERKDAVSDLRMCSPSPLHPIPEARHSQTDSCRFF